MPTAKAVFIEDYERISGSVVAVGTFDGLHLGHQAILNRTSEIANANSLNALILTFDPHPREVITPGMAPKLLTTVEEKSIVTAECFAGQLVIVHFDDFVRNMTAEQFARDVLHQRLHAKHLVTGYNHVLGKDRTGTSSELRRIGSVFGFEVEMVEPVLVESKAVSSSRVREAITTGNIGEAEKLLGHRYLIHGLVTDGIGLGKNLGYPTANISYSSNKCLPREGIYACQAEVNFESFDGMLFIGRNYFSPLSEVTVEAHLFEFDEDMYGQPMSVFPLSYIRENRRFGTTAELVDQMQEDKRNVLSYMNKGERKCQ